MRLRAGRRHVPLVAAVLLTAAVAFPLGAIANHQFIDVPTSNTFHGDIDAIADAGVTTGCAAGKYCPKDFVTREQMAAFLNRLGALGPGKTPVVNADKVDGKDEVLGAGDIVHTQQGPWNLSGHSEAEVLHSHDVDTVAMTAPGTARAILALDGPTSIDGQAYGLEKIAICYSDAGPGPTITNTAVWQSTVIDTATLLINNTTDRPLDEATCFELADATPAAKAGGTHLVIDLQFSQAASAWFGNVTTTWVPVG
jgi:hypothetical protein